MRIIVTLLALIVLAMFGSSARSEEKLTEERFLKIIKEKVAEWEGLIDINSAHGAVACPQQSGDKRLACKKLFDLIVTRRKTEKAWLELVVFSYNVDRRIADVIAPLDLFNTSKDITNGIWERAKIEYAIDPRKLQPTPKR
jgi:hypothetical protein